MKESIDTYLNRPEVQELINIPGTFFNISRTRSEISIPGLDLIEGDTIQEACQKAFIAMKEKNIKIPKKD